ncbi:ATP-binding protein [Nocardiopsis sp. CNR-923]|uniref:ATP-binding protein n=1 Tax=Nocardiopsis sp. CNR-923 TaxID=1904965 RepID=UPI000AC848EB|nr:ATP-binding protein [Nocardiopsis sp. CNR-923]
MPRITAGHARRTGPFVGGRPFGPRDRHLFLGRTETVRDLVQAWTRARLTVLHGDAGAGKTSLLQAGAVPALTDRGARVLPVGRLLIDPAFPSAVLPEQNPLTRALLASWNPGEFPTHGPGRSAGDFLRDHARADRYGRVRPLFAALDQTEPLLRSPARSEPHRGDLIDELLVALDDHPGLHLLLTARTEHLADLRRMIAAHGADHSEVRLGPLAPDAAVEAAAHALDTVASDTPGTSPSAWWSRCAPFPGGRPPVPPRRAVPRTPPTPPTSPRPSTPPCSRPRAPSCTPRASRPSPQTTSNASSPSTSPSSWRRSPPNTSSPATCRTSGCAAPPPPAPRAPPPPTPSTRAAPTSPGAWSTPSRTATWSPPTADGAAYRLRHPRLARPLLDLVAHPCESAPEPWTTADRIVVARRAHTRGEPDLAGEHARRALRSTPPPAPRDRATLTSLLGDLAFERGEPAVAAAYYAEAAELAEAVGDGAAVARLLVAQSSSRLRAGQRSAALDGLRAAVGRVHGDSSLRTGIGQALWRVGQSQSALDVLDAVLVGDRSATEARRTRNRIRAELTSARGLAPRRGW